MNKTKILRLNRVECIMLKNAINSVKEYNTAYDELWNKINLTQNKIEVQK